MWYNKSMPKKRKNEAWTLRTRGRNQLVETDVKEGYMVTMESIKSQILEIEQLYSSTMSDMDREWGTSKIREKMQQAIQESDDTDQIFGLLNQLDEGFSNPV